MPSSVDNSRKTVDKLPELGKTRFFILFMRFLRPPYVGGSISIPLHLQNACGM